MSQNTKILKKIQ